VRIAVVVHGYPPDEAAGVELVAQEQAQALVRRGHSLAVFARAYASRELRVSEVDGVEVWRVPGPLATPTRFDESWSNSAFDESFDRFLDRSRPDVVHAQHLVMLSCSLLERARDRELPTVLSLHDAFYLCHRLFLLDHRGERCPGPDAGARCVPCLADLGGADVARARFDFMARHLARVDALVAPSRALAERYIADLPFLAGRIDVVDPGIATPGAPVPRAYGGGRGGDPLRFLFVGTWLAHKGLDLLIGALGEIDPARWRLDVRGAGVPGGEDFVARLRDATRDLPVAWRGAFPRQRLAEVLAQNDVLVLPSRCDESYSRVIREARAAGLAVIASRAGGPAEALRDGRDGLLVEPGSAAELSGAIRRLLDDPELVRRLAVPDAGWPTLDQAAAALESIYARVTTRPRRNVVAAGRERDPVAASTDVVATTDRGARHDRRV
jgi:glycosyltransferase involved in cell wall biosynthesis